MPLASRRDKFYVKGVVLLNPVEGFVNIMKLEIPGIQSVKPYY